MAHLSINFGGASSILQYESQAPPGDLQLRGWTDGPAAIRSPLGKAVIARFPAAVSTANCTVPDARPEFGNAKRASGAPSSFDFIAA